jgi:multidrug efflux pump subunit AcrA (membrane-fusion protein)
MYARVNLTIEERENALTVPSNSIVDVGGKRGVFLALDNNTASFRPVEIGIQEGQRIEVVAGLSERDRIVTTGAAALREGDRILLAGTQGREADGQGSGTRGQGPGRGPGSGSRGQGQGPGRRPGT